MIVLGECGGTTTQVIWTNRKMGYGVGLRYKEVDM